MYNATTNHHAPINMSAEFIQGLLQLVRLQQRHLCVQGDTMAAATTTQESIGFVIVGDHTHHHTYKGTACTQPATYTHQAPPQTHLCCLLRAVLRLQQLSNLAVCLSNVALDGPEQDCARGRVWKVEPSLSDGWGHTLPHGGVDASNQL